MDNEIEEFVKRCAPYSTAGKAPTKTTLESWSIPSKPWSRIHIDYAGPVDGVYFLVVVDPRSKWPEVHVTKSTTAKVSIKLLNQSFVTFGVPEIIVSDNGNQFAGHEFQVFCTNLGIRHIRTPPQSNGLTDRFVETVKTSLRKIRSDGVETPEKALQTFLQVYRSTPTSDLGGKSPAEMMFAAAIHPEEPATTPRLEEQLLDDSDTESEGIEDPEPTDAIEEAAHQETLLLERGRRMIQLPPRFKPYWMTKP
ncbi:uncharacterized protein K02A2.6-like [Ochlerotatus camptorhynchus]|uniref:uncharacterized protein K02A2.6-like n=1 Tax=Ochlerotatus camptorhynchus TaxID=644619 RepID=UPI0031D50311